MLNGFPKTLRFVLGARRQWRGRWVVTSCPALVVKISAICVRNLGSQITKTISNATSIRNGQMRP